MEDRRGKYMGMMGALLVHLAILALLLLIAITTPEKEEESGVEVIMGNVENAFGSMKASGLVEVKVVPQPAATNDPSRPSEQDLITQKEEETVVVKSGKAKETVKPEKIAAEKAAEAKRLADEKAERERKAAAEAASKLVAGAFSKGTEMGSSGQTTGEGTQGTSTGSPTGASVKSGGGYGDFDLGGRSLGEGGLPRPAYNVQDEGKVVVNITVNPGGFVVATSINRLTNTVNPQLRKAAEEAAKKARFNTVSGVNNQMGTITYYFSLK